MLLSAAAPNALAAGVLLTAVGLAVMLFLATANTTLQLNSEPAMRGRVMALYGLVFLGSTPLGGPLLGWIAEEWGARFGLGVGGALSLAAAVAAMSTTWSGRRSAAAAGAADPQGDVVVAA